MHMNIDHADPSRLQRNADKNVGCRLRRRLSHSAAAAVIFGHYSPDHRRTLVRTAPSQSPTATAALQLESLRASDAVVCAAAVQILVIMRDATGSPHSSLWRLSLI